MINSRADRGTCASAVVEDIDGALERVRAQHLPTHGREAIDPFAKIHGVRGEKNAALGGELQHQRPSRKARRTVSSGTVDAAPWMDSRVPSARDSSSCIVGVACGRAGAGGTSTKPREVGAGPARGD